MPYLRRRRGYSLLFAVTLIGVLSFGASLLLTQMGDLAVVTSAGYRRQKLLASAQAGQNAGIAAATALLYPAGAATATLAGLQALPTLGRQDALCPDIDCSTWHLLAAAQAVGSDAAVARIGITCSPGGCNAPIGQVATFALRVLATLPNGDGRLLEATLALQ